MKRALLIPLVGVAALVLPSCSQVATSLTQPLDGDFNPLDAPGSRSRKASRDAGPKYAAGSWVEVMDANAMFYRKFPKANEQPDSSLRVGTPLKVVGEQGSYVKVETEGGQIGFVPAIMVADKSSAIQVPIVPGTAAPAPTYIDPIDPGATGFSGPAPVPTLPLPGPDLPGPRSDDPPFLAPEPEVPPISVEEAPAPVVPPDPVNPG